MKALSPEVSALLDKLYNLRGDDSVVLVEMNRQRNRAVETKTRTTEEKKELQTRIANLEKLYNDLNSQGEKLSSLLLGIDRNEYATVLERLDIDFNPQELAQKLNKSLPRTIDSVTLDTKKAEKQLARVEEEMNSAIATIDELSIHRDAALANQEKLNEYFELALTKRINITRDVIISLLEQFNFTPEESREAAKILMFPEDALLVYDEMVNEKEQSGKSFSDVFTEAKNADPIVEIEEAVKIVEEEPEKVEFEAEESPKDVLISLLKDNEIDYLDYSGAEIDYLLENYDASLISKNVTCVKEANVGAEIFVNHVELMLDSELEDKINILLDLGKEPIDIYLNPTVLEKYSKSDLEEVIDALRNNGMDPKNVPLMAY